MISDVLFEAVSEIERYQREMPDIYRPLQSEIDDVKQVIERLRTKLDSAPLLSPVQRN